MRVLWIIPALLAGCFTPHYRDGLQCGAGDSCPSGYHCAAHVCWPDGDNPDLGLGTGGTSQDLMSVPTADLSPATPFDLAPFVYPPTAIWIPLGGGGSTKSAGCAALNLVVGGMWSPGVAAAPSGASLTIGAFCEDTIE